MAQFINLLNERNSTESILLYFIVVGIAVIFAFLSQYDMVDKIGSIYRANVCLKRQKVLQSYIQRICLGISFLVLWFISAFADCGTDREAYGIIFTNVKLTDLTSGWQEPGFIIFNMIFRIFGDNPRIIYVAISTVTLYLF